jgi:hypothetical protein
MHNRARLRDHATRATVVWMTETMREWAERYARETRRAFATALTATRLMGDLWKGLNAGSLRYDPPADTICDGCLFVVGPNFPETLVEHDGMRLCATCLRFVDRDLIDEDPPQPDPNQERDASLWRQYGHRYGASWQDVNKHVEALAEALGVTGSYTLGQVVERVQALRSAAPRPEVVWERTNAHDFWAGGDGWHTRVSADREQPRAWRWRVALSGNLETTEGHTMLGEVEAKRRAEEALAVMLERLP